MKCRVKIVIKRGLDKELSHEFWVEDCVNLKQLQELAEKEVPRAYPGLFSKVEIVGIEYPQ